MDQNWREKVLFIKKAIMHHHYAVCKVRGTQSSNKVVDV
jgi:hypothetical protein